MRFSVMLACAAVFLGGPAAIGGDFPRNSFPAGANGGIGFLMPSNNIECNYTPDGGSANYQSADGGPELSCDRLAPTYLRFTLEDKGPAYILKDVGDQFCCGGTNVFAYGTRWQEGPFSCESSSSGLNCERKDGHGFFISKARTRVY